MQKDNDQKGQNEENNLFPPATPIFAEYDNDEHYNCSECPSLIELLSINEMTNSIKFKCLNNCPNNNNNGKIMPIQEYFENMKKYKNKQIDEICEKHNKEYIFNCLDCNSHLCEECIKTRKHISHKREFIKEIQLNQEEVNIIKNKIKNLPKNYNIFYQSEKNEEKKIENDIDFKSSIHILFIREIKNVINDLDQSNFDINYNKLSE